MLPKEGPKIDANDLLSAMSERIRKAYTEADEWKSAYTGVARERDALKAELEELKPAAG